VPTEFLEPVLSRQVIGVFYDVYTELGFGFLETAYRRALSVECRYRGIPVAEEVPFELRHRGVAIGFYRADLIVDERIVIETKTGARIDPFAPAQVLNYLKASGLEVGLVFHFGPKPEFKRVVASRRHSRYSYGVSSALTSNV
jgi:GxxExxY protein